MEAENYCKELGGHLASFQNRNSLTAVAIEQQLIFKNKGFWIGFNTINRPRVFQWTDGSPNSFTNWNLFEPNNFNSVEDCVEMMSSQGWNDVNCYVNRGWICKIPKGLIPTTNPITVPNSFPGELI